MNNDKLILRNQLIIMCALVRMDENSESIRESLTKAIEDTKDVINPKEVVPYEDSLEVCDRCGNSEIAHPDIQGCKEFVKSSKGEGE